MPIDPLPSISRSDANFRTKVDDFFLTKLPAFSTQAESARVQIVAAESTTTSAASTASTDATTATTAANTATSARDSAVTAKNAAETAAAQAVSGNVATPIHEAVSKTTPVDADELGLSDSAATWGLKKLTFADLKAWIGSFFVSKSGDTITGNLNFGGVGRRITGDFSNAAVANRLSFQTSTANTDTNVGVLPNGTGAVAAIRAYSASDPTNASVLDMAVVSGSDTRITSLGLGTGTSLPMTFYIGVAERLRIDASGNVGIGRTPTNVRLEVNGKQWVQDATLPTTFWGNTLADYLSAFYDPPTKIGYVGSDGPGTQLVLKTVNAERLRIDASGNVLVTGSGGLGYGVGSGGTVTQATSKSTAVTLNKPSGRITMHAAELAAGAVVYFALNNTQFAVTDMCTAHVYAAAFAGNYEVRTYTSDAGQIGFIVKNVSATPLSDALQITFQIHKGAIS